MQTFGLPRPGRLRWSEAFDVGRLRLGGGMRRFAPRCDQKGPFSLPRSLAGREPGWLGRRRGHPHAAGDLGGTLDVDRPVVADERATYTDDPFLDALDLAHVVDRDVERGGAAVAHAQRLRQPGEAVDAG